MPKKFFEIGVGDLDSKQLDQLNRGIATLELSGPLVGALGSEGGASLGESLRGLVLHGGKTYLLKQYEIPKLNLHLAQEYFTRLSSVPDFSGKPLAVIEGSTLYYAHIFFPSRAAFGECNEELSSLSSHLSETLKGLWDVGLFHGNLVTNNIFFDGKRWTVIDVGVSFLINHQPVAGGGYGVYSELGQEIDRKGLDTFLEENRRALGGGARFVAPKELSPEQSSGWFSLLIIFLLVAGVSLYTVKSGFFNGGEPLPIDQGVSPEELRSDWLSEDREKMLVVAGKAINEGSELAQTIILESALSDYGKDFFFADALINGYRMPWRNLIPPKGKDALFAFTLAPLLKGDLKSVPDLSAVHIGVLFALVSGIEDQESLGKISTFLIERHKELPSPYRRILGEFIENEGDDLNPLALQALCQILNGDLDEKSLSRFFKGDISLKDLIFRYKLISSTLNEEQARTVLQYTEGNTTGGKELGLWLSRNKLVDWKKLPALEKIRVLAGEYKEANVEFPYYGDLIRFPEESANEKLADYLNARFYKDRRMLPVLEVLRRDTFLTRPQVVSLLSAFSLSGDKEHAFIEQWFSTKPQPEGVIKVLLARAEFGESDPFAFPAARYLRKDRSWAASTSILKEMARHSEPMARGVAYAKLNPKKPDHLKILKERAQREQVDTLKNILKQKIASPDAS